MFQLTRFSHSTVFFRNQNARYAGTRCTFYFILWAMTLYEIYNVLPLRIWGHFMQQCKGQKKFSEEIGKWMAQNRGFYSVYVWFDKFNFWLYGNNSFFSEDVYCFSDPQFLQTFLLSLTLVTHKFMNSKLFLRLGIW